VGIQIEAHHHEVATGGQNEIDMRFTTLTSMADNLMIYKYVVKNTAQLHGMTATFCPNRCSRTTPRECMFIKSLWKGETNLFYSEADYAGLSELGRTTLADCDPRLGVMRLCARPRTPIVVWCRVTKLRST